MDGAKRYAPATLRNRLSGSGQHAVFFAVSFSEIIWQPTDADPECLASIAAWATEAALPNLRPPLRVDAEDRSWTAVADQVFDAVVSINMIYIAPWESCQGLMAGAARAL